MSGTNPNSSFEAGVSTATTEPKLSRSNNVILIEQSEVIDKEAAYKQRLNRPFKVIQHLPLSQQEPNYEQLDNPLSIRDSATLYNSLIVSRHHWLHNVFKTFWTRREQYMTPADGRKKDRLSKMCDMKLVAGPHTFEIRLFILKEEEKEKRYFEELERRREERQKLRDERLSKPCDPVKNNSITPVKKEPSVVAPSPKIVKPLPPPASLPEPAPPKPAEDGKSNDLMANPENAMMIQNLNLIARSDPHLSSLMKIVASGNASSDQIAEFQRYIQRARQMGNPASYYQRIQQQNQERQDFLRRAQDPATGERRQLTREERERLKQEEKERKAKEKEEKKKKKQLQKEQERLEKERERQERKERRARLERERQERQKLNLGPIDFGDEFEMDKERERREKREKKRQEEKAKLEKLLAGDDRLTAFQERYTKDATLIIEFHENNSSRFYFPKDSIIEIIDERDKADDENDDRPVDDNSKEGSLKPAVSASPPPSASSSDLSKKYKKMFVELLISFVMVHNQREIDAYEMRKKREEEEKLRAEKEKEELEKQSERSVEIKEEDEENGEIEHEEAEEAGDKKKTTKKKRKAKRNWGPAKRQTRTSKQVNDEDLEPQDFGDEDVKPVPIYSTSTLRLVEVPYKFAELIKNSANPLPEVQQKMKDIFATGKRLTKYHVWYRLDGLKDELLAETLRFNLNRLEYISGGGKLKGKAMLKRIVEKSGSEAEVSNKRQRRSQV
ncbi:hypothetical protein KL930_000450 [Ogataea haglerorum]|nr:hypothetical protein KL915_000128 [Ogataea haglerorum]KAG7705997.1 hypothetical protein KL950_003573 [Ogataea haglerorum]KAG7709055.1 hypothetical protein KL914_001445 [Ogataea haglerorum]KAG7741386.1 hypothetical protein KL932_002673 [Ogataea haglerorum]KAG7777551.1 hypothetical protein KL922_002941 [Ogataea haglerorum]